MDNKEITWKEFAESGFDDWVEAANQLLKGASYEKKLVKKT